ncbi:MAG: glycoside hydrolase family 13 protein [Clostridia bacterium]|nr:glycoside hydrolase family 13 protein [Clostridia bacterium]
MIQIDFERSILHDSAKERYRYPIGAVSTGDKVTLKLQIRDIPIQSCFLSVIGQGSTKMEIPMKHEGDSMYSAEYEAPHDPTVVWYYFTIHLDNFNKIYYGPAPGWNAGLGQVYWSLPPSFQLTVVKRGFHTPDWFKGAVMYQIFPDRFRRGNPEKMQAGFDYHIRMGRSFRMHKSWEEGPEYMPVEGEEFYQPSDFFGGDLAGIEQELPYLADMGVEAVYLNPIFEAASNHRYNTADYLKVDPILGTTEDFERLCELARGRDIRVILDGVFSHTGADSVYFNQDGHYPGVGAAQDPNSPYHAWYTFFHFPDKYRSWWGFESLPEVDETKPDWINFIIKNDDSVINTWLDRGASGFRLDVADELPDQTIEQIRHEIKEKSEQDVLIGEVWEDATTKQAYGINRTYALGDGLDSVMNYPFLNATIDFFCERIDVQVYKRFLVAQAQNYPKQMYYALMNILSSHDVARVRTLLATHVDPHSLSREQQAHFVVTEEQDARGAVMQRLAAMVQFSIPGSPCIYYGDEVGMNGLMDPFNRMTYTVRDTEMRHFYSQLANARSQNQALKTGWVSYYARGSHMLGILRWILDGYDAFGNPGEDGIFVSFVNRSSSPSAAVIDLHNDVELMPDSQHEKLTHLEIDKATSLLTGAEFKVESGLISEGLEPYACDILQLHWN